MVHEESTTEQSPMTLAAPLHRNPSRDDLETILHDPDGGGAIALLEDGDGTWWAWRRESSDTHFGTSVDLEESGRATFPYGKPLNRRVAYSADEAIRIMRDLAIYGPRGSS